MLFGSTRELSSRRPVGQFDYGATPIQTSNFSCTGPNAYITNTLNKLIFTQSSARFLFLSRNNRRQTKFKHRLRLFSANCIWSRLSSTCSSLLDRTCKKSELFFSMICLSHIFPPFWSAITAVCNYVSLFFAIKFD